MADGDIILSHQFLLDRSDQGGRPLLRGRQRASSGHEADRHLLAIGSKRQRDHPTDGHGRKELSGGVESYV